jgi:DNA repair exonuclease SbcCD ATPase subunit
MMVTSLEITGFRAFSGSQTLDLDADTVLVVGANGQGKTSMFDAIFWALAGEIPRLKSEESVVSVYSQSGEARVALGLRDTDGKTFRVIRRFDGNTGHLVVEIENRRFHGPQAETELLQRLWPEGLASADPRQSLRAALERGVYLQQDLLTDFLSTDKDNERFTAISELVGTGRVNELQIMLERSRLAWSRVTNVRATESQDLGTRLTRLEAQLAALAGSEAVSDIQKTWQLWWREAVALGLSGIEMPPSESIDAPRAVDAAVKQLQAIQLSRERRRESVRALLADLEVFPVDAPLDLSALRESSRQAAQELARAREALTVAEETAAALRRTQVELRQGREEMRLFAQLALRHLEKRCPVCEQTYDREATRQRLERLARGDQDGTSVANKTPDVSALAAEVQEREKAAVSGERRLLAAEQALRERAFRKDQLSTRLAEYGLPGEFPENLLAVRKSLDTLDAEIRALVDCRRRGEDLALGLARVGERARQAELEREIQNLRREFESAQREVNARQQTGELVTTIIDALRDAASDIVEHELGRVDPLLQRVYATVDPHPAFRVVKLISRMRQGRGRILPSIADPSYGVEKENPGAYLSSSQMNVLAVSVFLAISLGMPALPLRTSMLDDPLQSLDDLNLLGLIDLLRRMRERRQVMISTHDPRFAGLLERKLRPIGETQRTAVIDMQGWSREGPAVVQRDVARDREPVRIAV